MAWHVIYMLNLFLSLLVLKIALNDLRSLGLFFLLYLNFISFSLMEFGWIFRI